MQIIAFVPNRSLAILGSFHFKHEASLTLFLSVKRRGLVTKVGDTEASKRLSQWRGLVATVGDKL